MKQFVVYLQEWGLELELFGENTFSLVRSYLSWFPQKEVESFIFDVFDWLKKHGKLDIDRIRESGAKMMACKAAIKANRHLRLDEMVHLINHFIFVKIRLLVLTDARFSFTFRIMI